MNIFDVTIKGISHWGGAYGGNFEYTNLNGFTYAFTPDAKGKEFHACIDLEVIYRSKDGKAVKSSELKRKCW